MIGPAREDLSVLQCDINEGCHVAIILSRCVIGRVIHVLHHRADVRPIEHWGCEFTEPGATLKGNNRKREFH